MILYFPCNSYSDCSGYKTTLKPGKYKFEVWGAEGGKILVRSSSNQPPQPAGKGGYSKGVLSINEKTDIFVYIGGSPTPRTDNNLRIVYGGFNGGGGNYAKGTNCNGGGGATDIRIITDDLFSRIIVAGSGGSAGFKSNSKDNVFYYGGSGGGLEGETSGRNYYVEKAQNGGKQDGPGDTGYGKGSFGYGGNHSASSGGGGADWFGGSASSNAGANCGGAGGSGYVFTEESFKPNGFLLTSKHFLKDAITIGGIDSFPTPENPLINETGHSGHGAVKITFLDIYTEDIYFLNTVISKLHRRR